MVVTGYLFGERYTVTVVRDEEQLVQTYDYIGGNPAKAGLCDASERWPWSWADYRVAV